MPLQWGFGAGAQTWLFSMNGKFYESLVSYFPEVNGLAMTLGDDVFAPHNLVEALGRELGQQDVKSCFGCHTTGALVDGQLDLAAFRPGVTCEHCHAGAGTHMADAMQAKFSSAPPNLGAMSSEGLSNFCGQCHRSWSTVVTHLWFGEVNVRFAPYRLANSKCFTAPCPYQLRGLPQSAPECGYRPGCLRYEVSSLPRIAPSRLRPNAAPGATGNKGVSGRHVELRQLPHAKSEIGGRAPYLHRSLHPRGQTRRAVPTLVL